MIRLAVAEAAISHHDALHIDACLNRRLNQEPSSDTQVVVMRGDEHPDVPGERRLGDRFFQRALHNGAVVDQSRESKRAG